jgi:hypothetical protein
VSEGSEPKQSKGLLATHHLTIVLVALALIEAICFGPALRNAGFYLDDWQMMTTLKFGPQPVGEMIAHCFFGDSRVTIRPVEALHFGLMYSLFGLKPLGYHLLNAAVEVICAWLLYACCELYSANRSFSFLAAVLLLLLPLHDSTHYWMVASSVALSLAFYLASVWLTIQSDLKGKTDLFILSVLCFAISIFNYEMFMPLCVVNASYFLQRPATSKKEAWMKAAGKLLPFIACIAGLWLYQRFIVPMFAVSFAHAVKIDPSNMVKTLITGIQINLPTQTFPFYGKLIESESGYITFAQILSLIGISAIASSLFAWLHKSDQPRQAQYACLAGIGAAIIVLSYTVFGLNPEYLPSLNTILNRVNTGASIGASLIIAAGVGSLLELCKTPRLKQVAAAAMVVTVVSLLALSDWVMSKPWIASWQTQKHVWDLVQKHKSEIKPGTSLILSNCPRYALWSPVFDGVWDFQNMVRIALGDNDARAGVVSERMELHPDQIKDVASGYVCGVYPIKGMFILFPQDEQLTPVHSASDFVDAVQRKGMTFGLSKEAVSKWQATATASSENYQRNSERTRATP